MRTGPSGRGRVADLGCGPGHVTRHLAARGVDIVGIDLAPSMIATARRLSPGLAFAEGDFFRLDLRDGALAERAPYEHEYQTCRLYALATRA